MKTIKNLRNSLKFKAPIVEDGLLLTINGKSFLLEGAEVRLLAGEQFAFISIPSTSVIVRICEDEKLRPMSDDDDAAPIEREFKALVPRKERKSKGEIELPEELRSALLQSIPAGFRLQTDADGNIRLVKTRNRKKGGPEDEESGDDEE